MIKRIIFVAVIIVNVATIYCQKAPSFNPDEVIYHFNPIVCPADHTISKHYVPLKKDKKQHYKRMELSLNPLYGPGVPEEVKTAVEQLVFPILQESFSSPIPINILFLWEQTGTGTLASASPDSFWPNFEQAAFNNVFYPLPLAEKIARQELNNPGEVDIEVTINSNQTWCFDCNTPEEVGQRFDFVSTILHEIYHGMGIFAFAAVTDGAASQRNPPSFGISAVFNIFMELRSGERTILEEDGSQGLLNHFQSNQLFFNLPTGGKIKLFAPNPWEPGSSVSHLDEATYNGGSSALMTPASARGEVERNAGVANDMMYDMGWIYTNIYHEPVDLTTAQPSDQDFIVSVDIITDNGINDDSLRLHYSSDGFATEDNVIPFIKMDDDTYEAAIAPTNIGQIIDYYIEAKDVRDNRFSNPGINFNGFQFTHQYAFGEDEIIPELAHEPVISVKSVDSEMNVFANSSDVFAGLDTIVIEWQLNGVGQPPVGMVLDTIDTFQDDKFVGFVPLPDNLTSSDNIEYRIVATDKSVFQNQAFSPETGFHQVAIEEVISAIDVYINDFNVSSSDFEGNGFKVSQPAGFPDMSIHSEHPYEAAGADNSLNFVYELSQPIRLLESGLANMEFDEIVLVEPGDPGVPFGIQEFWDYVIVEGKRLGTSQWRQFLDGYDSRADEAWRLAFENSIVGNDSQRLGDPSMFRKRRIDLLESGFFGAGDEVLIRFRLFSDPLVVGWGWAVDNLVIQDESVPVSDFVLEKNFGLVPNPVDDIVTVVLDLESIAERITITLVDITGRQILVDHIDHPGQQIRKKYAVDQLISGIYFVNVTFDNKEIISKKLIINR